MGSENRRDLREKQLIQERICDGKKGPVGHRLQDHDERIRKYEDQGTVL